MNEKKIQVHFMGGAMEVGASCMLVQIEGHNILMDCGIRQRSGSDPLPDLQGIKDKGGIDAILLSHAHMDHLGAMPMVARAYPGARIYCTTMTMDLARVLLKDSLKLMNRQEDGIPMYAKQDVEDCLAHMVGLHYEQPLQILPGLTLTLYQAGHIAGAACLYLESASGSLFYSGDICGFAQNAIEGMRIPKLRPDIAIVESTYGDRLHANRQIEEEHLIETVQECIRNKGKMLIPAFALGRAQEVLLILRRAMSKKQIPPVRIYVDGMVRDMCTAFLNNPWYLRTMLAKKIEKGKDIFYDDNVLAVDNAQDRKQLLNTSDPVVFVSSSGMLTGGPSVTYAEQIAPMENGWIATTGYQDEEAPGRMIQTLMEDTSKERTLLLNGNRVPVRCHLEKIGLSAHADQNELTSLLERITPHHIFLVHGDPAAISSLSDALRLDVRTRIYCPKDGDSETIYIRNPRKQWKKSFPAVLNKEEPLTKEDCSEFYDFWKQNYPLGRFNIQELAYIWHGTYGQSDHALLDMLDVLLEDKHFTRDRRRGFLICLQEEEEIAKRSIVTQQDLLPLAKAMFAPYRPRKIGYFEDLKEIKLQIDLPGLCDEEYESLCAQYQEKTGFSVVRNSMPNPQAMLAFLAERVQVTKFSYRDDQKTATVTVQGEFEEDKLKQEFTSATGYALSVDISKDSKAKVVDPGFTSASSPLEQNAALSMIDRVFAQSEHKPYKKGLKSDSIGRYVELSFLTPQEGLKQEELLKQASACTGWRVKVSPSVNQNGLISLARSICKVHGLTERKTPSWQPTTGALTLHVEGEPAHAKKACEEIAGYTGIQVDVK